MFASAISFASQNYEYAIAVHIYIYSPVFYGEYMRTVACNG